jgi:hypothetical protein
MNLTQVMSVATKTLTKKSPAILTGLGVGGVVATAILAVMATDRAKDKLYEETRGNHIRLSRRETVALVWQYYIPTTVVAISSIGCIIGSQTISLRREAVLASLYSLAESNLEIYKDKVRELVGRTKEDYIQDEVSQERLNRHPIEGSQVIIAGGDSLCFDSLSARYFMSGIEKIRAIVNSLNHSLMTEMYVTVNEFYSELGLESIKDGDLMGWSVENGLIEIQFNSRIATDGRPALVLDYKVTPTFF